MSGKYLIREIMNDFMSEVGLTILGIVIFFVPFFIVAIILRQVEFISFIQISYIFLVVFIACEIMEVLIFAYFIDRRK